MTDPSILTLDSVTLALPDGRLLFHNLNATFDRSRTGLVGRNGVGKSLLAQVMAGQRAPSSGTCQRQGHVHLLGQQVIEHSATVADLAQVGPVIAALQRIEQGSVDAADFDTVGERWGIREQLQALLQRHGLGQLDWRTPARCLSGGQAMRVALIGAWLSDADYLILDEPSNHLDGPARAELLGMIKAWDRGMLVISHDRTLLGHMARILELSSLGLRAYGGDYNHYLAQKSAEATHAEQHLAHLKRQQLRQARDRQQQRENLEKAQARAGRTAKVANQAKIIVDRRQQVGQATLGKQRRQHRSAEQAMQAEIRTAAGDTEQCSTIHVHAPTPQRHAGRQVLALQDLRLPHGTQQPVTVRMQVGQRLGLVGANGSGKSTLLRMIDGQLPSPGDSLVLSGEAALLDQHCTLLNGTDSALQHLQRANPALHQGELRSRLAQLGLDAARVGLPSSLLSGGERMKAALAAILYRQQPLDLLLLDEPGNHLDLPSLQAVQAMLGQYRGALIIASHDAILLEQLALDEYLKL
ncbi:ATP-binding cassette domain-containing protein [Pseudomonas sp. NBRC 111119]|uniref:ATP-binding cassette domain-containing protein n=1 Tax=Pseudomonas sp. NBRC 111119 TaxID=1661034 RepID=UPI000760BE85|nr:ATP-binding cassette domain-containing protein [Pseudomonas sp. NBRC 111119]